MTAEETILSVEDNEPLRQVWREILSNEGLAVVAAGDGRQALQSLQAITPA